MYVTINKIIPNKYGKKEISGIYYFSNFLITENANITNVAKS